MSAGRLGWLVASVLWLTGCTATTSIVRKQASFDLQCQQEQLDVEYDKPRFIVAGCDQVATYVCSREAAASHCKRVGQRGVPHAQREPIVRAKASQLLDCDPATLDIEPRGTHYLARGCGLHIEYECVTRGDCCAFSKPGAQPDIAEEPPASPSAGPNITDDHSGVEEHAKPKGSLSKAHIRAVINASIDQIRACYEAELKQPEGHAGVVVVRFTIAPNGQVEVAALLASSLSLPNAEQCIVDSIKRLRFAKPKGGGIVVVTYPFVLQLDPPAPHAPCL